MLVTLVNWIYIFATTYVVGFFLLPRIRKLIGVEGNLDYNWLDNVIAGIVTATVYAQVFSLFYKVGLVANLLMIACALAFIYIDRERFRSVLKAGIRLPEHTLEKVGCIALALFGIGLLALVLMFTAESTFHYDTGLYHAQAIHWLEDYGIIKGLGLVHVRLAYNSAYFPLCALYSMRSVMGGQSLHSMSGFLFAIMCAYSVYGWQRAVIRKRSAGGLTYAVSSCIRLASVFYFLVCLLEITSPESDYVACNLIIWVFLRLCEIYEEEKDGDKLAGYCLVAIAAFAIIAFKLSAAVIPLITLWPLVILIRKKQVKSIIVCGILCAVTVLPYVIRNVIICGWPVYPFAHFDLFDVAWKMPRQMLENDATEIGQWAGMIEGGQSGIQAYAAWAKTWWDGQYLATQLFVKSLLFSLPVVIFTFFDKRRRFIRFLAVVIIVSLLFYFKQAPLIRYSYGPVLVMPLMMIGYMLDACAKKRAALFAAAIAASLVVLYPSCISVKELIKFDYEEALGRFSHKDYLVRQIDYPLADVREVDWYGNTVYLPAEGDQCWYYAFPSSPYHECFDYNKPMTDDLGDGVCPVAL